MNKLPIEPSQHSFFDDSSPSASFELIPPTIRHEKELSTPSILSETLCCRNLTTGATVGGKFALHSKLLSYYKNDEASSPELVLEIAYSRLKTLTPSEGNQTLGFSLTKNGGVFEFYFSERVSLENWINALKNVCVLSNFHEEYKATKVIGKGSFAKVYLVDSKSTGMNFAVKAFAKEGLTRSNKGNAKETMLNEIDIMRDLDHKNVIKLYEVHETERSIYLVMELIEGRPLQQPFSKHTFKREFSEAQTKEMIRSILDALAYMASKEIMHRDLKPDNILIDKTGQLKIVDFGLATYINLPEYLFKKCGTPGYIAPEVFKYDVKNPATFYNDRCDVFSAGCILFYMLFGSPFFDGSRASEILQQNRDISEFDAIYILKKEIKDPDSKINKEGLELLLQLLEYSQKKRTSAAQALNHPYFSSTHNGVHKQQSIGILISDSPKHSHNDLSSPTGHKNPDFASSFRSEASEKGSRGFVTSGNRYAEKDSLYLDLGKPEMNGKISTLQNNSFNNSLLMKGGTTNSNNNSLSAFAKQGTEQEGKSPNRSSFRGGHAAGNQSFLKAAIMNQMHKNSELGDSPVKKDEAISFQKMMERRSAEGLGLLRKASSPDSFGSEDANEGKEGSLKIQLESMKGDGDGSPKNKLQLIKNYDNTDPKTQ